MATNVVAAHDGSGKNRTGFTFKLGGFGSSLILSDYYTKKNKDPRYRLLSRTFPWEAPEADSDSLTMREAVRTDIYSFGLLLARIFLDGNCPFDEEFDIRHDAAPRHDKTTIEERQGEGGGATLASHIAARLESLGFYTKGQLVSLRVLFEATLARDSKKRASCMWYVVEAIKEASTTPLSEKGTRV